MYFLAKQILWANAFMIIVAFFMYLTILSYNPHALVYADTKNSISTWEVFYFTIITHSTVGCSDIIPNMELMRIAITFHILCLVVINAIIVMSTASHIADTENMIEQTRHTVSKYHRDT
jgi:hypothetical protein